MTTTDLIRELAEELVISEAQARCAVEAVFARIRASLCRGETVTIRDFGRWGLTKVKGHVTHVPAGRQVFVPPHQRPSFRAAQALKDAVWRTVNGRSGMQNHQND